MQLRTIEEYYHEVEKVGHRFSTNTQSGVTAVSTKKAVDDAINSYTRKVSEGVVGASEKVILIVRPVFTIAASEFIQRPIHTTGMPNGWYNAIQAILEKMFGVPIYRSEDWDDREKMDNISRVLFRKDSRIYVPFADNYSPLWQLYSATSINDFHNALKAEVPTLY